jgi:eukaryotic-like serine/threonine-protein kinase
LSDALTLPMRIRIMIEVLAGLEHAHDLQDFDGTPLDVVHRDVSPHNVFLTYNGQVKVVDFGIAKAIDSCAETRTGMLKGKIGYMAPEQARGDKVDARADIFAAGVMLWELVTGQRLFKGESEMTILHKLITHQIPPPSSVNPATDAELEAIVLKALAADPAARHGTARELSDALAAWLRKVGDHTNLRDLGRILADRFADERASIRTLIEAQIREAEAQSGEVTALVRLEQSLTSTDSTFAPPADEMPTRTMGTAATVVVGAKAPEVGRKGPFLWGAIATVIAGAVAAIVLLPSDRAVVSSDAAPKGPLPATYVLRIESRPPAAMVQCDGRVLGVTPLELDVPAGDRACDYVIAKAGYEPLRLDPAAIVRDTTLTAQLVAEAPAVPGVPSDTTTRAPAGTSSAPPTAPRPPSPVVPRGPTPVPPPPADIRLER